MTLSQIERLQCGDRLLISDRQNNCRVHEFVEQVIDDGRYCLHTIVMLRDRRLYHAEYLLIPVAAEGITIKCISRDL